MRESNNFPGDYTLCVVSDELRVEHYHILYKMNKLTLDDETFFENLIPLVEVCFNVVLTRLLVMSSVHAFYTRKC